MRLEWKTYSTSKSGNQPDENEDACFPESRLSDQLKEFRCAVSDGATSTSFSKIWAQVLVEASARDIRSSSSSLKPLLQKCQTAWNNHLKGLDLPWHALQKTQQGAFSTLLWFKASQTGYSNRTLGVWQALAVGDTCFCHLREGRLQAAFPIQKSCELNNSPFLLSSIDARNDSLWKNKLLRKAQGAFEGGDEFLFMTDALAGWFLQQLEAEKSPLVVLEPVLNDNVEGRKKFDDLIRRLRMSNAIKNDDTTLGYLKIQREETHVQEKGWN